MKKIIYLFLLILISTIKLSAQYSPNVWYQFQNNLNNSGSLGNSLNGSMSYNLTYTVDRNGVPNSALQFSGNSSKFSIPNVLDYSQRSWSFWVNATTIDNEYRIIFDADNNNLQNAQTQVFTNQVGVDKFIVLAIGANHHSIKVSENVWNHIVLIRDSTSIKFYFNGCLVFTGSDMSNNHANNGVVGRIIIGANRNDECLQRSSGTVGNCFIGALDELRVYNCAISQATIDSLNGGICPLSCKCGKWAGIEFKNSCNKKPISLKCFQSLVIKQNETVSFNPVYTCPTGCKASFSTVLRNPDGSKTNVASFPYTFSQSVTGVYYIRFVPKCGDTWCEPCIIKITVVPECDYNIQQMSKEEVEKLNATLAGEGKG